jgi:hypothetical protein
VLNRKEKIVVFSPITENLSETRLIHSSECKKIIGGYFSLQDARTDETMLKIIVKIIIIQTTREQKLKVGPLFWARPVSQADSEYDVPGLN